VAGTGKSFIGALVAKVLHDRTNEKILVVCFTNHALDQFLEDLVRSTSLLVCHILQGPELLDRSSEPTNSELYSPALKTAVGFLEIF